MKNENVESLRTCRKNLIVGMASEDEVYAAKCYEEYFMSTATAVYRKAKKSFGQRPDLAKDVVERVYKQIWSDRKKLSEIWSVERYIYDLANKSAFEVLQKELTDEVECV